MQCATSIREKEREMVLAFKQIIKLHFDYHIHRVASLLQIGKERAEFPWMIAVHLFVD
jgi:hypothetical protein